jgi:hypothetical protein
MNDPYKYPRVDKIEVFVSTWTFLKRPDMKEKKG